VSVLVASIGDSESLDFLARAGPLPGESKREHRHSLEMLRRRLIKEYVRVGLEPPPSLARKAAGPEGAAPAR
jgi:hypothetical protein